VDIPDSKWSTTLVRSFFKRSFVGEIVILLIIEMSVYRSAASALNGIISGSTIYQSTVTTYSLALQKLYIKYVKMMPSSPTDEHILGPRAFFVYLAQRFVSGGYTPESLEESVKEMVRNATVMDTHPTETAKGEHLQVLKIFVAR
jgi:hypothetical protein